MDIQARFKRKDRVEPKLQEKATMAFLRSQPDFVSCPSSTCKDGASMADGNIFTCRTCQYRYCFACNVPFHEDEGCQEFQDRIQEDERKTLEIAESLEEVSRTTKPCPKCKVPIQKGKGCDHMSCTRCKYQYCWLCFAEQRDILRIGNHMHERDCKHWRHP
ncbi:unnamed protein product [Zymoseptoria tritici ST99CH_1A5]|uniref:RBR-type E3 ubiquitin transferase n=2 Tax=Zymoseptoria tritici TaxID=1047171 RepID=A0A1X7S277_ZYMT9|nr:unnamed protein product [Zymoseptoria tritici ST99CH_3D7]SMR61187.1 unnamed protein product [Zymoseptoria tritici ST99CH_3D1]SMY27409.1 unnamed protein product [Zymoseptoria tritici ST99CH_1A5]